ncbi:MAG: hypothetical protein BWY11_01782 [Firmicutes bacterium ADurb.Bin182]|nr:MAG: hypothetical protein BWY11_01782 [Firmicutes bacterium ADurb.Bin182]
MDEILHTVAMEYSKELELHSMRASIQAKYRKRLKTRSLAVKWISAAAVTIVLIATGIFSDIVPLSKMKSMPEGATEQMDQIAEEDAQERAFGILQEETVEAPKEPAPALTEGNESLKGMEGEVLSTRVIDAGRRTFVRGDKDKELIPGALPEGWDLVAFEGGWTASKEGTGTLECWRIGEPYGGKGSADLKQAEPGRAVLVAYRDGTLGLYYRPSENVELYFHAEGVDEQMLTDIALSVGIPEG